MLSCVGACVRVCTSSFTSSRSVRYVLLLFSNVPLFLLPDTCRTGYLANFRDLRLHSLAASAASKSSTSSSSSSVIPPSEELDRRVTELHKLHRGQNPAEAEFNFLEHAKRLEMYGISLHAGKDSHGRDIQLGVTSIGLVVFQHQVKGKNATSACVCSWSSTSTSFVICLQMKINTFSWSKIVKISFKRKQFFIQLRKELTESYDTLLGFNLASYRSCKNLWKSAVEHHSFFRWVAARQVKGFGLKCFFM